MTREYSQDYQTLMNSDSTPLDDQALSQIQNNYFIVFVRGFLGNVGALLPGGYFRDHKEWLGKRNINAYKLILKPIFKFSLEQLCFFDLLIRSSISNTGLEYL